MDTWSTTRVKKQTCFALITFYGIKASNTQRSYSGDYVSENNRSYLS